MVRLPRVSPAGVPVHLIQRGNNRHSCFVALEDFRAGRGLAIKHIGRSQPSFLHSTYYSERCSGSEKK